MGHFDWLISVHLWGRITDTYWLVVLCSAGFFVELLYVIVMLILFENLILCKSFTYLFAYLLDVQVLHVYCKPLLLMESFRS